MKKIIINGRFLSQPLKGVQRFAREIATEACRQNPQVEILAPKNADLSGFEARARIVGHRTGHLWEQWDLPRALKAESAFLINLGNTAPLTITDQLVVLHDVAYLHHPESYNWKIRFFYKLFVPAILRRARVVATVSLFSRREISRAYALPEDKIHCVYNAVSPAFRNMELPRERFRILTFAHDSNLKNYETTLRAAQKLSQTHALELRSVGNSSRFHTEEEKQKFAKGSKLTCLGRIDDETLVEEYNRASCFVFAPIYAGFGIPPIEAQTCGCPVIVGSADAFREVLGDSAIYFDKTDADQLSRQLERVLSDQELSQQLSAAGLANAGRFSWADSAAKILELSAV